MTCRFRLSGLVVRGRLIRWFICGALPFAAALGLQTPAQAQQSEIRGRVVDAELTEPLSGVTVKVVSGSGRAISSATTNADGEFRLTDVPPGRYRVVFSAVGYESRSLDGVDAREASISVGTIELTSWALRLNPVVVSASRGEEKLLDAPAAVYSVGTLDIELRPSNTAIDHVRGLPGIDIITSGLIRHSVAARGFNTASNDALFFVVDNRGAARPWLRTNAFHSIPTADDDIERIEVVLGPASALYGPNTANGVLHVITRSPLEEQGSVLSIMGGERDLFQGSLRHAGLVGSKVGYKISGSYFRGDEWRHVDPTEAFLRQRAIESGADPDTLLIGLRDFDASRITLDGRLDFLLGERSTLVVSSGYNRLSSIEQTPAQTVQVLGGGYAYVQARLRHNQLFAQAYVNWLDGGEDSYLLRSGRPSRNNSFVYVGQIQHASLLGARQRFVYGADLIRRVPDTYGLIHGRNEDSDEVTEIGGYLLSETQLSRQWQFVAAARLDYHSVVDGVFFSPRAAIAYKPAEDQDLRLTYNRAFRQPSNIYLFADFLVVPGSAFDTRVAGGSYHGYSFQRDCSSALVTEGLCMRSPFTPESAGGPSQQLPLDATLFWDEAVAAQDSAARAVLGAMAQPDATQVSSVLGNHRPTGPPDPVQDAFDVNPLRPEITNTVELGYKGLIGGRLLLGADVYYTHVQHAFSPALVVTPNVYMDSASVHGHIASEASRLGLTLTPDEIGSLAVGMAGTRVATVTPEDPPAPESPADVFLGYRNFGKVNLWGVDVGALLILTDQLSVWGSYSFVSRNYFENVDGIADIALNAPKNKATLAAQFRSERLGLSAELRGRFVEAFPANNGSWVGPVETYTLLDAYVTYVLPLPFRQALTLSGVNVLDNRHQEFPGAPYIGRLVTVTAKVWF